VNCGLKDRAGADLLSFLSPMSRFVLAFLVSIASASVYAQEEPPAPPPLVGTVQGNVYVSPTGAFKITIPVIQDLGGSIIDTQNSVTFQDPFSMYVTIVAFPMDATQKWQMDIAVNRKEYLVGFFRDHVVPDFRRSFPDVQVEPSARYLAGLLDGAFLAYMTLPGGSMFAKAGDQIAPSAKPPVAKRANLVFVRNNFIFVISTELAERVTEGTAYHQTSDQEDELLRDRLVDLVGKMQFIRPPAPAAP
jgi:hypothetical protein